MTPTLANQTSIDYIASCQTYEGGFGGEPFSEAHGGYAYCAIAALQLVDRLDESTVDMGALLGWLVRRQMPYEGGFCGRSNKLVDGCYSFWQGGAMAVVSAHYGKGHKTSVSDPWLPSQGPFNYELLFDIPMLQRYILLCAQDVNGGLRDKPSKNRDFYHTCYNLSGLSVTQHCGSSPSGQSDDEYQQYNYGHPYASRVAATHPCYNIRLQRVEKILEHFKNRNCSA